MPENMHLSLHKALGYLIGGLWTGWGGRTRIEAKQLRNLRRLVDKARGESPLFRRLYAALPPTAEIELYDLPVTHKPELMAEFDDWLTIRSLPLDKAREHLRDLRKVGVPIDDVAVFQTSGTSGEPRARRPETWRQGDDYRRKRPFCRKRFQQTSATVESPACQGLWCHLCRG